MEKMVIEGSRTVTFADRHTFTERRSSSSCSGSSTTELLEVACKEVDYQLVSDRKYPELATQLGLTSHVSTTYSGVNDFDYPAVFGAGDVGGGNLERLLSSVKRVPLPDELVEQFTHMQCNCVMGLFPEISRAWLAVDSDIFVWNYEDGSDVAYFDGLNEVILAAGLIRPKPGVFQEHIKFLLCITTPVDIVVLGVGFGEGQLGGKEYREMHLQPDPLFVVATDNVYMTSVTGTANGRIFLSGKDGCVYELTYQAHDTWFRRKCKKINHSSGSLSFLMPSFLSFAFSEDDPVTQIAVDNTRNILYSRTEKGNLQVFDLGDNGQGMKLIAGMNYHSIATNAYSVTRTIDRKHFQPIVHIAPIPKNDSTFIDLVAITSSGVRLYFTTTSFSNPESRPSMLRLVHIRMPPGFAPSVTPEKPNLVHSAFYRQGTTILTASVNEDVECLWCLSDETFPFQTPLKETQVSVKIDGRTWCLAEIPDYSNDTSIPYHTFSYQWPEPPAVVTQHVFPPRRFVLLSSHGSHVVTTLRPMEQLRLLLLQSGCGESEGLESFFKLYGEARACATCLALICQCSEAEKQVAAWATHAFFRYGGEPTAVTIGEPSTQAGTTSADDPSVRGNLTTSYIPGSPVPGGSSQGSFLATPIPRMAQQSQQPLQTIGAAQFMSSTPAVGHNAFPPGRIDGSQTGKSGKHDGIALYLSRILRPVWEYPLVMETYPPGVAPQLWSRLSGEELSWFVEQLYKLRDFVDRHSHLRPGGSPDQPYQFGFVRSPVETHLRGQKVPQEAYAAERASLLNLHQLIQLCCESIEFWRILCEHQINIMSDSLTQAVKDQLRRLAFKEFVVSGQEVSSALITCLMSRYIDDHATIDAVSNKLREVCTSLYSADDALYSKANEVLCNAKSAHNMMERDRMLQEAILVFRGKICESLQSFCCHGEPTCIARVSSHLNEDTVGPGCSVGVLSLDLVQNGWRMACRSSCFFFDKRMIKMYQKIPDLIDLPWICRQLQSAHNYDGLTELALYIALKRDPQGLALYFYKTGEPRDDTQGHEAFVVRQEAYKCILEALDQLHQASTVTYGISTVPSKPGPPTRPDPDDLTVDQAKKLFENALQTSLSSGDELFHVALYKWFITKGMTNRLIEIASPFVEPFIRNTAAEQHPNNLGMLDILWKHYEKRKNYMTAAKILMKLAERELPSLSIHERLEYLSRAIMSAKSCNLVTSASMEGEFLHELEEKLEVARIQLQVYEALSALEARGRAVHSKTEALANLNSQLMDVSQLYGDYADPFDLAECKLSIVHCSSHYDPTLIEEIWKDIVGRALKDTREMSPEARMTAVNQKLVAVAKLYISYERYFPLEFLVFHLENVTCELQWDPTWVFVTLGDAGVPLATLFTIYDRLFKRKDTCWQALGKPLHLLDVISLLMTYYLDNQDRIPAYERPSLTRGLFEACASYLVELESMNTREPMVERLLKRYKGLQARLRRAL